jgi:hypothetical protein
MVDPETNASFIHTVCKGEAFYTSALHHNKWPASHFCITCFNSSTNITITMHPSGNNPPTTISDPVIYSFTALSKNTETVICIHPII